MSAAPPPIDRLAAFCLTLPEARREGSGPHAAFRVRTRTFAYYLDDHHGDGIVGVVVKAPDGLPATLVAAAPDRFYRPAYLGPRGWVGLRLDAAVDWAAVDALVIDSYRLVAPKRLAALVSRDGAGDGPG